MNDAVFPPGSGRSEPIIQEQEAEPEGQRFNLKRCFQNVPRVGTGRDVNQNAGGIAIESDVPIGGLLILPPEGGVHSIDPASISAIAAP